MKTYEDLITPRTSDEFLGDRILALKGISHITQSGGDSGLGDGAGYITFTGSATTAARVVIKISTSGEPGSTAYYQVSYNGGATYSSSEYMPSTPVPLGATGVVVTFHPANDGSSPSFALDDEYSLFVETPVLDATAWQDMSVPRRLLGIECDASAEQSEMSAAIAKGACLRDAVGGWVDLHAQDVFGEERQAAVSAQGQIVLTDAASIGPVTIGTGDLWAGPSDGSLKYSNIEGGSIPLNGSLRLTFQGESPGSAWNAPNGSIVQLLTPIAGVSIVNGNRISSITKSRPASPTVTSGITGTLAGDYGVKIEIQNSGGVGTGLFRYSLDDGITWAASSVTISATYVLGSSGITTYFPTGSYLSGDTYVFDCSISWLSQPGVDAESDDRVKSRCRSKWGTLAMAAPDAAWEKWAKDSSAEVTKVLTRPSPTVEGQTELYVAGTAGGVSSAVVTTVDSACQPHAPLCTTLLTQSASTYSIAISGTVYVKAGKIGVAQANAYRSLASYQESTPIGGNIVGGSGIVSLDVIMGCITGGPNASIVKDVTLTAPASDVSISAYQAPVFDTTGLVWVEA